MEKANNRAASDEFQNKPRYNKKMMKKKTSPSPPSSLLSGYESGHCQDPTHLHLSSPQMSSPAVLALAITAIAFVLLSVSATVTDQTISQNLDVIINDFQNMTDEAILPNMMMVPRTLAREFLLAHNKVRAQFNEPPLQWDKDLARYARRWGYKRTGDCKMIHTYGPHGENLFWGGQDHWTATEAVDSWASEREYYNLQTNECQPNQMCGHYTQIIWKDSLRLGCARAKCDNGGLLVICEYDPPGNYIDESPIGTTA